MVKDYDYMDDDFDPSDYDFDSTAEFVIIAGVTLVAIALLLARAAVTLFGGKH